MVHRREIDGEEIVLGNQGDLWKNALTLYDHDTGSIWSQPTGEAILGPLAGARLELLPSSLAMWGDWKSAHPNTFALDAPSGTTELELDELLVVVELGSEAVAFPVGVVRKLGVVNTEVDGVPVAITVDPAAQTWRAFYRRLDDGVVELDLVDGILIEVDGMSEWNPTNGLGVGGTVQNLDVFPASTSFPDDYPRFYPDGTVWSEGAQGS